MRTVHSKHEAIDRYHKWLGIPPHEQPANHYRLLGIALFESDADVIEAAAVRQIDDARPFLTLGRDIICDGSRYRLRFSGRCSQMIEYGLVVATTSPESINAGSRPAKLGR